MLNGQDLRERKQHLAEQEAAEGENQQQAETRTRRLVRACWQSGSRKHKVKSRSGMLRLVYASLVKKILRADLRLCH
jgi:hypothetical protein